MWIKTTKDNIYADEPAIGTITEEELIGDDNEARDILFAQMAENQELPTTFYAIDDFTDEDIELETTGYLTSEEIDMFNSMFMETDEWTEQQLSYIYNNLKLEKR